MISQDRSARRAFTVDMQLEVGNILEGKVTGITKFGAFVELPGGKTGMVHISEVAATYVKEIRDFVKEDDVVKVKILSIGPDGKIGLSMKQALPPAPAQPSGGARKPSGPRPQRSSGNRGWSGQRPSAQPQTFEDMLTKFKQTSDEKMSDLRRGVEPRRTSRRGGNRS